MSQNVVLFKQEGRTATLTINRPESLNALNKSVLKELAKLLESIENSLDLDLVVIDGAGERAFVAGADIKEMQSMTPAEAREFSQLGSKVFSKLAALPQITIAKIQGFALGGGLELALAADILVASDKARFGLPEVSLGLIPGFGGTQRLARRIGRSRALQWMVSADKYSAEEAQKHGLLNEVVKAEDLTTAVEKLVKSILKNAPGAIKSAKKSLQLGIDAPLNVGLDIESLEFGLRFASAEVQEGINAFFEKRPANFN